MLQSEARYRVLLENLPQKIFFKDRDLLYVSCNDNLAHDLGMASEEVLGKSDYDFFPEDLADKYREDDIRVLESGETITLEESYIHDGEEFVVQTVKTLVEDENGEIIGVLGIFWDINRRKRAERELERYRHRLEELV
ncbi:MAG: PAS domain-containing protein [Actinomycetota bacterium]|nr:PAS domain-containing protein [Actinomycetota bacterium]